MNKKTLIIALIVLFVTATVAFASSAGVSYTDNSVTVWNTGTGKLSTVELCVIYIDAAGIRRETSMSFSNVRAQKQTKSFNLGKVIGAYSTFCAVPIDE